jgi:osmotically-inducible protein OsmY
MLRNRSVFLLLASWLLLGMVGIAAAGGNKKDLESRVQAALSPYYMHGLSVNAEENGTVTVKGTVDALYDKLDIYQRVSAVQGVTRIKDLVVVNAPIVPDATIQANVIRTIKDNSVILEPGRITVNVTDGMVFLDGTVSYQSEKLMATTIASWQDGVKGVENRLDVLASQEAKSDENIKTVLEEIVKNHFPLVSNAVGVKVENGNVTVNGKVQTLWDKSHLKEEFLQVAGVKSVVENLLVQPSY